MKRLQISDKSPKAQNCKTPEIGNKPEKLRKEKKKETTKLEARYKVYPNMNPAEDNSSWPQPSYKKKINEINHADRKPKKRLLSHNQRP